MNTNEDLDQPLETVVGAAYDDLLVGVRLLVELKCVDSFSNEHLAQCINYRKASALKMFLFMFIPVH